MAVHGVQGFDLCVPAATYRLQLSRSLSFREAEALVPYLDALGVTDCYTSPILRAGEGSTHGYDISDHGALNPELGTRDDFRALAATLTSRGMGLIVDFVPNHMGNDARRNAWWWDVLENGPSSPYARYFDIDWLPVKPELRDKVLLPILGDQYGVVLERGELQLRFVDGALVLTYFDRVLPINPRQAPLVLGHGIDRLVEETGPDDPDVVELRRILGALLALPSMGETGPEAMATRQQERERARLELATLVARAPSIAAHLGRALAVFNGERSDPRSYDRLHGLLEVQAYRLAYWRTAFDEINYRRFFDVNDLAGLRMENPQVFDATHALLLDLIEEGSITGLRIDHPDGLFDPAAYLQQLRAAIDARVPPGHESEVYLVVEKILARGERLRDTWPVQGTTGYDALNVINGVFVLPDGLSELRRVYRQFTGYRTRASDTMYASKRFMMRSAMASELNILTRALNRLSEGERRFRDFTLNGLRRALTELIACFPVYRTYVTAAGASPEDVAVVDAAIVEARRRNPVQEPSIYGFIRQALLPASNGNGGNGTRDLRVAFAHKFQQYTAPVVAKGVEDTAFYNDVLLVSTNEVGGDLRQRARSVAALHQSNADRLGRWPRGMTAGSTHDTKWGEDARARINVLSELPHDWRTHVRRWSAITETARERSEKLAPDRNDEWLFYQALIGAWPAERLDAPIPRRASEAFVARMQRYMRKALKEAKRHTGWLHEDPAYERAVEAFVDRVLRGDEASEFLNSFVPFQRRIAWFGMLNSLSQLVLRLASPGVPDIYQGSELWNLSMVDPDNRQPVDFRCRQRLLTALEPLLQAAWAMHTTPVSEGGLDPQLRVTSSKLQPLLEQWPDGRVKLFTLVAMLRLRRAHPALFLDGDYEPLADEGADPHLVAFSRRHSGQEVVTLVPRFIATLLRGQPVLPLGMERWRTASVQLPRRLSASRFVNIFTGELVEPVVYRGVPWLLAGSAFQTWPVAAFLVA
jgi:(1->4)-alpha-D-glucan 1-alpha-D-glucosylmutase